MTDEARLETLIGSLDESTTPEHKKLVREAYAFSQRMHAGQKRQSGEPFFHHPYRVSLIVASEIHLDAVSIVAALLHDLVEDTKVTLKTVEQNFGIEVAQIVDGLTKLAHIHFRSSQEKQAENFRKMLLAMSRDIRVILIKLADRVDNMRTIVSLSEIKRRRIAKETLEIYAPLANRLGMGNVKTELEDAAFSQMNSEIYQKIKREVTARHTVHQKFIEEIRREILRICYERNLIVEVQGRVKNILSVYNKMQARNIDLDQVYDVVAFRIVTRTVMECYEVLGILHAHWRPVPGKFKDYIAMPKPNLYQSLHTVLIGPRGQLVEIQIRTEQMHQVAEIGIASHWKYKERGGFDSSDFNWLNRIMAHRSDTANPHEFISDFKTDLSVGDIYVFTPKGDVLEFPEGATPLDFAYAIHTELGHKTTGAIVNGKEVSLRTHLQSGDIVEITASDKSRPSKDWLKFVVTAKARHKIRAHLRGEERNASSQIGHQLLESAFRKRGKSFKKETEHPRMREALSHFGCASLKELLIEIGYGKISADGVVSHIFKSEMPVPEDAQAPLEAIFKKARKRMQGKSAIEVSGINDVLIRIAKCCNPLPGEDIVGFVTRGRGVTVHSTECPRVPNYDELRVVEVNWKQDSGLLYEAAIRVITVDVPGILSRMSRVMTEMGVNITKAHITTTRDNRATNVFHIGVHDIQELNTIITKLEKLEGVFSVFRERGR